MGETCSKTCQDATLQKQNQQNMEGLNPIEQSIAITYQNGTFNLPNSQLPFQRQSTYAKIEKAAYNFCQGISLFQQITENHIDLDFMPCITRIIAYRQQQVFLAGFQKAPIKQKQNFMQEVNRIPQDQIDLFYHNFVRQIQKKYSKNENLRINVNELKNQNYKKFKIPNCQDTTKINEQNKRKYIALGRQILARKSQKSMILQQQQNKGINNKSEDNIQLQLQNSGQVALVIMCAGSSSRFNNQNKFLAPLNLSINPSLTLLDFLFIRLISNLPPQKKSIPIIITCNEFNFKSIQSFLREREYFGLDKIYFRLMEVQSLPVLDLNGKYCINQNYKLIKRPFGTSRSVIQIIKDRHLKWLKEQNVQYLHFIGAQNLMQNPFDPLMLGMMIEKGKKISSKCVGSSNQWQKLPRYVESTKDNKIYMKLWNQLCTQFRQPQIFAFKLPIATNSLFVNLKYLQQLINDYYTDIYLSQHYHILRRKQKILHPRNKKIISTECITFEGDIRDLLACCADPLLLYVERNQSYAPLISKNEEYSLSSTVEFYQQVLTQQYKQNPKFGEYVKGKNEKKMY